MKIGPSESIETITPAHWRKMAQESRVGWPMPRERIVGLCGKCIEKLPSATVLSAANDPAMAERVAGIIQERSASLLQGLK
ncbi:MAG: hypothetical protein K9N49_04350 [Candidatus Marinimicrobia bacterium]|nr:hypothetical protein [Candidatus Neomarinimicrobiota bacterium]